MSNEVVWEPISVKVIDHMGSDLSVVNAARVSFSKRADEFRLPQDKRLLQTLARGMTSEEQNQYKAVIGSIANDDESKWEAVEQYRRTPIHWACFAHPHVSIHMNIPIFLARQLVKHQAGGVWNEVSRRYVDDIPTFWKPRGWRERGATNKQGSGGALKDASQVDAGNAKLAQIVVDNYVELLRLGVCPEQARIILPVATMTQVIWTGSLYFFARVYNTRIGHGAQAEAAEFAAELGKAISPLFPHSWAALTGN